MGLTQVRVRGENWVFLGGVCYVVSKVELGMVGEGGGRVALHRKRDSFVLQLPVPSAVMLWSNETMIWCNVGHYLNRVLYDVMDSH